MSTTPMCPQLPKPAVRRLVGALSILCLCVLTIPPLEAQAAEVQPTEWTRYHVDSSNNALIKQAGVAPVAWRSPKLTQQAYTVSVVGNRVYGDGVKGKFAAFALDRRTGKVIWNVPLDNGAMSQPLVVGNRVFIGSGNQTFFYRNGIQYKATLGATDRSGSIVDGSSLYITDDASTLYHFDAKTGKLLHRMKNGGGMSTIGMVLAGGTLFIPSKAEVVNAIPTRSIDSAPHGDLRPFHGYLGPPPAA